MSENLTGKVALVTGASSGIGRAVTKDLLKRDVTVVACARRYSMLQKLAQEIENPNLHIHQVNLTEEKEIISLFSKIKEDIGHLDILINNAGLSHKAPLMNGCSKKWREMLEVNILGLCITTREAIALMEEKETAGHIIHISSMAGYRVPPGGGVYAATKHAVRALTEALRQELYTANSKIKITSISPALVQTEFMTNYLKNEQQAAELYKNTKVLDDKDVVAAIIYALTQPPHVQVHDVLVRSKHQAT